MSTPPSHPAPPPDEPPLVVICVDDNALVGAAVARMLSARADIRVAAVAASTDGLAELAARHGAQVVLLDVDMPGGMTFNAVRELARTVPDVRVVMLSAHVRRELVDTAFEAGAWGYLAKTITPDDLIAALAEVRAGRVVISKDVQASLG